MGPELKVLIWYPGTLQTAIATISKEKLRELPHQLNPRAFNMQPPTLGVLEPIHLPIPLYLYTTIDLGVHLTLNAQINSQVATALVDSGATRIFMHPKFAQHCQARIKAK